MRVCVQVVHLHRYNKSFHFFPTFFTFLRLTVHTCSPHLLSLFCCSSYSSLSGRQIHQECPCILYGVCGF